MSVAKCVVYMIATTSPKESARGRKVNNSDGVWIDGGELGRLDNRKFKVYEHEREDIRPRNQEADQL